MTSEHAELVGEMSALEKLPMADRLKHAKKRRAQQLKAFAAYEKQLSKAETSGKKASSKKIYSVKNAMNIAGGGGGGGDKAGKSTRRIRFESSILLLDAASRNDREEVNNLLKSGVSPDVCNEDGLTALHQCCIDDLEDIVRLLVQYGANVNARDSEMWTPLHAAATCGHVQLCKYLCECGAELLAVNADGNMPYDLCEDGKTLDYIESQMSNAGITQELIDDTRLSSENKMLQDLKAIAAAGGNVMYVGRNGETPLHVAACYGFLHVTEFLLDQHVPIDVKDNDEWQPIHCAACWGQLPVVEILIEHGSDCEAMTRSGETAIDLCDDIETRIRMQELMAEMEHKEAIKADRQPDKLLPDRQPEKTPEKLPDEQRTRNAAARRGSTVNAHAMRRGSINISQREAHEENQRLIESMTSLHDEEEDDVNRISVSASSTSSGDPSRPASISQGAAEPGGILNHVSPALPIVVDRTNSNSLPNGADNHAFVTDDSSRLSHGPEPVITQPTVLPQKSALVSSVVVQNSSAIETNARVSPPASVLISRPSETPSMTSSNSTATSVLPALPAVSPTSPTSPALPSPTSPTVATTGRVASVPPASAATLSDIKQKRRQERQSLSLLGIRPIENGDSLQFTNIGTVPAGIGNGVNNHDSSAGGDSNGGVGYREVSLPPPSAGTTGKSKDVGQTSPRKNVFRNPDEVVLDDDDDNSRRRCCCLQ